MEKPLREIIGERVAQLRQRKHLTQTQLGELANMSLVTMNRIERGRQAPSVEYLYALATVLDCSTDYLFGRTDDPKPPSPRPQARQQSTAAPVG